MPYEFHTILPVTNSDGSTDKVWVQADMSWNQTGVPQIDSFFCDDPDVAYAWTHGDAPMISLALIDDAIRLHNAYTEMQ